MTGRDKVVMMDNGPHYDKKHLEASTAEQLAEAVLYRIVRGDAKGRCFGTPRNPRVPTIEEFNPSIVEITASDLAEVIVARRHGLFPEQVEFFRQVSNDDLLCFNMADPISATEVETGLSLTGGHHRTSEIIRRVASGEMARDSVVRILIHD